MVADKENTLLKDEYRINQGNETLGPLRNYALKGRA